MSSTLNCTTPSFLQLNCPNLSGLAGAAVMPILPELPHPIPQPGVKRARAPIANLQKFDEPYLDTFLVGAAVDAQHGQSEDSWLGLSKGSHQMLGREIEHA
jgi:hypothetical protein